MSAIRRHRKMLQNAVLLNDNRYLMRKYFKSIGRLDIAWRFRENIEQELKELKRDRKNARFWIHRTSDGLVVLNYDRYNGEPCYICGFKSKSWREFAMHQAPCIEEHIRHGN